MHRYNQAAELFRATHAQVSAMTQVVQQAQELLKEPEPTDEPGPEDITDNQAIREPQPNQPIVEGQHLVEEIGILEASLCDVIQQLRGLAPQIIPPANGHGEETKQALVCSTTTSVATLAGAVSGASGHARGSSVSDDIGGIPGPLSFARFLEGTVPTAESPVMFAAITLRSLSRVAGWFGSAGIKSSHQFFAQELAQILPEPIQLFAVREGCYVLVCIGDEAIRFAGRELRAFCANRVLMPMEVSGRYSLVNLHPAVELRQPNPNTSASEITQFALLFSKRHNP